MSLRIRRSAAFRDALRYARAQLRLHQGELGAIAGFSRRTVVRWELGATVPAGDNLARLVRSLHLRDPALAARVATAAGSSLERLGVAALPAGASGSAGQRSPTRDAFDLAVHAAAEAMDASPRAVRPGVVAALGRLAGLGVSLEGVVRELATDAPQPSVVQVST